MSFKDTVKAVFGNSQLMIIFVVLLANLIGLFGRLGIVVFYMINNVGRPDQMAVMFTVFSICSTAGQVIFPKLATYVGKARMVIISLAIGSLALFGLFFTDPHNLTMVLVFTAIYGLTLLGGPIMLSMIPDAVDYYELKSGIRADGTAYATVSLSTKIASAVGGAVGMFIIGAFGYTAGEQATEHVQAGINIATNLVPAALAALAIIPMFFYTRDRKKMESIREELDARGVNTQAQDSDEAMEVAMAGESELGNPAGLDR